MLSIWFWHQIPSINREESSHRFRGYQKMKTFTKRWVLADWISADWVSESLLTESHLTKSQLTGSQLTVSQLIGSQLTDSQLTESQLTESQLTKSHLTKFQLTGSHLTESQLTVNWTQNFFVQNMYGCKLKIIVAWNDQCLKKIQIYFHVFVAKTFLRASWPISPFNMQKSVKLARIKHHFALLKNPVLM